MAILYTNDHPVYSRLSPRAARGRQGGDSGRALKALGIELYASEHEAVANLCQSQYAAIRGIAADTLGRMTDPQALAHLAPMITDADKEVRNLIAFAMGKIRNDGTVPPFFGCSRTETGRSEPTRREISG